MAERKQKSGGEGPESGGEAQDEDRKRTRAERRGAGGGRRRAGRRKQAAAGDQATRADRPEARGARRQRERTVSEEAPVNTAELESRLSRIEEAVAHQSERSEELLGKLDEVLHEARKSARHPKSAAAQEEDEQSK